jgi:hypothetical protein
MRRAPGLLLPLLSAVFFLAAQARAAGFSIEGRVLAAGGPGIAGARIELRPVQRVYDEGMRDLEGRPGPAPVAVGRTSPQGWFHLTAPGAPAVWRLVVLADGFVAAQSTLPVADDVTLKPTLLEPDAGLTVRVEGPDGHPLAGARVAVTSPPTMPDWEPVPRLATTGADGTVRLPRSPWRTVEVRAFADGFAPAGRSAGVADRLLTLRLQPGLPGTLRVVDGDHAVSGAVVRDDSGLAVGRTDEQGNLEVRLPPQSWKIRVDLADGRRTRVAVAPAAGEAVRHPTRMIRISPAAPIEGRVIEVATRRPLAGALVLPWDDPARAVTTDGLGRYRWSGSADGPGSPGDIAALAPGYFVARVQRAPKNPMPTLALSAKGRIEGMLVNEQGAPVPAAEVRLVGGSTAATVLSSRAGRFLLASVPADRSYRLAVFRAGFAITLVDASVPPPPERLPPLQLVLRRGVRVEGRLVDPDGHPVAGAGVILDRLSLDGDTSSDGLPAASSGKDGSFALEGLPAGKYVLNVRAPGFLPLRRDNLELPPESERIEVGRLALVIEPTPTAAAPGQPAADDHQATVSRRHAVLTGTVLTPEGEPAAGAMVWNGPTRSRADGDGRFRLEDLVPGSEDIEASHPDYLGTTETVELQPGENRVDLTLGERVERHSLTGHVLGPHSEPVAGARIQTRNLETAYSASDGSFVLEVDHESWEIVVDREGYAPERVDDRALPPGIWDGLVVRMEPEGSISGRITGVEPGDLLDVLVNAQDNLQPLNRPGTVYPDGTYRIPGVGPGRWSVEANLRGTRTGDDVLLSRDQPDAVLDLSLTPDWPVQGRVANADGSPASHVIVSLSGYGAITDEEGQFEATLKDGEYRLDVLDLGNTLLYVSPEPVRVAGAPVEGIEIRLEPGGKIRGHILGIEPEHFAEIQITALHEGGGQAFTRPQADGSYEIGPMASGTWTVTGMRDTLEVVRTAVVAPGRGDALVDLPFSDPGFTLAVQVVGDRARRSYTAQLVLPSGRRVEIQDTGGVLLWEHVPAGHYHLVLQNENLSTPLAERDFDVSGNAQIVVDLGS